MPRLVRSLVGLLLIGALSLNAQAPVNAISGTKCKKVGVERVVRGTTFRCAKSGRTRVWRKVKATPARTSRTSSMTKVSPPVMTAGGADLEPCRLREARTTKFQPWNVGFPRGDSNGTAMVPSLGRANVQLIAIEFPDALGTSAELTAAEKQIAEFDRWFEFTSKGQLSFNWQFPKQWFRMSRSVASYGFTKGDINKFREIASEMVSISDAAVDYTDSSFVFVLFPRTIKLGSPDVGHANNSIPSAEGPVRNLFGGSEYFYERNFELWSFWIHEYGHPMGLAGHTPRSNISIMDNQNGESNVLGVWDAFLAGWLDSDELYCMPLSTRSAEVTLIALEKMERGPRGAIVPISPTNGIVIESHRAEGWGERIGKGVYGLSVYWVDTTTDTNRYAGSSGFIDSDVGERWADHLVPPRTTRKFDLLQVGDTVTYRGVTVTFTKTGAYDTVSMVRAS